MSHSVLCGLVTTAIEGWYGNGCGCIVQAFDGLNLTLVPAFADSCPQRVKKNHKNRENNIDFVIKVP